MILVVIIFIIAILIIGCAAFCIGPAILEMLLEAYHAWVSVIRRFKNRRNYH